MGNLVLKIDRDTKIEVQKKFIYKDIDAFTDKYAIGKVDLEIDVAAVKASMRNIFMWNVGEEILYPNFGNNLRKFLYQPLDETSKAELSQEVKRCVEDNEPRVHLDLLTIDQSVDDAEHSTIRFSIKYTVIGHKGPNASISDVITITGGSKGPVTIKAEDK